MGPHPSEVFERTVDEGELRLERDWAQLCATGAVGGIDVGMGVLALLVVKEATGSELLAELAFGIGFLALTLARSELFTENFLIPIAALAVVSLEMFAALHLGAPFGYLDWLSVAAWASLGNLVGGVCLVTVLRLVQVGRDKIAEERAEAEPQSDIIVVANSRSPRDKR